MIPWSIDLRGKLIIIQLVLFPRMFWSTSSLPCSNEPTICPYSEPDESNPRPLPHPLPTYFLKMHVSILPSTPGSSKWSYSLGFRTKFLYAPCLSPIHSTCPAHHVLLDWIIRMILNDRHIS